MVTKRIAVVGVAAVIAGLGLCGCSGIQQLIGGLQQQGQEPQQQQQAPQDEQLNENVGAEVTTENEGADENVADEETTPQPSADISDAVDASKTTDKNPVPFGQWARIGIYATEDESYHDVYVRIKSVVMDSDDKAAIDDAIAENNEYGSDWSQIDRDELKVPDDVELGVMTYEVYVPDDFPSPDYGMTSPHIAFSQSNVGGGGFPSADGTSTYIGLGTNGTQLETAENNSDSKFEPGNTYEFKDLFMMVKGYDDYVFKTTGYPDGTLSDDNDTVSMYDAYFAAK